jgi:acyl-CoA reductase-like NAD-dependent aldehyde dehydrogenase
MTNDRVSVGGVDVATGHFINGERVGSATTFEDRSPLDWNVKLAEVARGGALEAEIAVTAAVNAFPAWAALTTQERQVYLHRLAGLIDANIERIATVECLDMAMLLESLRLRVIGRGARNFRAYADLAVAYEPRRWDSNGTHNSVLRMPAGPTVVITPWNAPFMLSTWKCAPALAAGNTVVLKPAEWSPLSCSLLDGPRRRGGVPTGRLQHGSRARRRGRRRPRKRPSGSTYFLHWLSRDRSAHRRRGRQKPRALHRRIRWQGSVRRLRRR